MHLSSLIRWFSTVVAPIAVALLALAIVSVSGCSREPMVSVLSERPVKPAPTRPQARENTDAALPTAIPDATTATPDPTATAPAETRARVPATPPDEAQGDLLAPWFEGTAAQRAFWEGRYGQAAVEYERLLGTLGPSDPSAPRARLLLQVARTYSGQAHQSAAALPGLVGTIPGLDNHILLLAAEALMRAQEPDQALALLKKLSAGFALGRRASLLRARALAKRAQTESGQTSAAILAYRDHLKRYPGAPSSVRMELAALYRGQGKARQEARMLRGVLARAPHTKAALRANERLKMLPKKWRALTREELGLRLKRQYEGRHYRAAERSAARLMRGKIAWTKGGETTEWCRAAFFGARSLDKRHRSGEALAMYRRALKACDTARTAQSVRADLLYFGGKRELLSGELRRADTRLSRLMAVAPNASYVDDALLLQADIRRGLGQNKAADQKLARASTLGGDMAERAAWRLFWRHYEQGHFKRAAQVAGEALGVLSARALLLSRGRLVYWQGRALQKRGERVRAAMAYARTMRDYPLTWYSQLARQRLLAMDKKAAEDAVAAERRAEKIPSLMASNPARLREPGVARAVELLRLGLRSGALAELKALQLGAEDRAEVDWLRVLLLNRAGDYWQSYRIARWRRPEYQRHWPSQGHEERWRLAHPRPPAYRKAVTAAAKDHHLPEALLWAVIRTESGFRPAVVSNANAVGLMQLILPTGRAMAKQAGVAGHINRRRLSEPTLNVQLGTRYLEKLGRRFEGNPALMAAGYNAGPGGPKKWLRIRGGQELDQFVENIPYDQTRRYTKSVVTAYLRYTALYSGASALPKLALQLPQAE